jgi:Domain of unknown function (DUF4384)
MRLLFAGGFAAILVCAQTQSQPQPQKGAKALFYEAASGKDRAVETSAKTIRTKQRPEPAPGTVPAVLALKLAIELREPDGSLQQVSPTRVFHSGERIRLHVTSNVDGNLVIHQKQDSEPEEQLFPGAETAARKSHVQGGADVVLPSERGWFRFDDHPGQILLTVMLTADGREGAGSHAASVASAEVAHAVASAAKGSKALRIEDDPVDEKAHFQAVDSRLDPKIPAGVIAEEIVLSHGR